MIVKSVIAAVISISQLAMAAPKYEDEFLKACAEAKRKASLCRCWSRGLNKLEAKGELSPEQQQMALQVVRGQKPEEGGNTTSYDNLADLLAGLESECSTLKK